MGRDHDFSLPASWCLPRLLLLQLALILPPLPEPAAIVLSKLEAVSNFIDTQQQHLPVPEAINYICAATSITTRGCTGPHRRKCTPSPAHTHRLEEALCLPLWLLPAKGHQDQAAGGWGGACLAFQSMQEEAELLAPSKAPDPSSPE